MSYSSAGGGLKTPKRTENYFSIEEILASQEKIPCTFEVPVQNLGFLDPSGDSDHIAAGSKLELPFWLAKSLCGRRKHTVSVELPKQYKEGYREILTAEAGVVDLHKWGPFFYQFGTYLLHFEHPESPSIAKCLLQALQDRFRGIMDSSQNASHEDVAALTKRLDSLEEAIFDCGQQSLQLLKQWEIRQTEKLATSNLVLNHRKRKRALMDGDS